MFSRNYLRHWFGPRHGTIRKAAPQRPSPRGPLQLVELESRLVMTAAVSLTGGVLRAVCDNAATAVTLNLAGTTTTLNGRSFANASISRIEILGGTGNDTIKILDTPAGKPVTVKAGGGNDTIHIGNPANMASVRGALTVDAGTGDDVLRVENASASSRLVLNLGTGYDNTYLHASAAQSVTVNDPTANGELGWVAVGASKLNLTNSTDRITGAVHVNSAATLFVMDAADAPRTITIDRDAAGTTGRVVGLTAVPITYAAGQVFDLGVEQDGHGGNTFLINNPAVRDYTSIGTGLGNDVVNVLGTTPDLYSVNFGGRDTFTLGSLGQAGGGTLASILGDVLVGDDGAGVTDLVVDNGGNLAAHDIVFGGSSAAMADLGATASFTGLPGEIAAYSPLASVTLRGGANDTFTQVGNFDFSIDFDQDALGLAAIRQRHAALGGDQGGLGAPITGLQTTPDGRAMFMDFQHGAIYWTAGRGALALHSGNWVKYQQYGRHTGPLGLPTSEQTSILNNTAAVGRYEGGAVYYSQATGLQALHSGNWLKYQELGAHNSGLGLPTSEETSILNGTAVMVRYQRGAIYWSQGTGAHAVHSGNWVKYQELGAHNGGLGLPTSDETTIKGGTAVVATYQRGAIYYIPATNTMLALHSGNWLKYQQLGAHDGPLGLPLSEHIPILNGTAVMARYQNGAVYWSPATDTWAVWGLIAERYHAMGGASGLLGLPISDEFTGIDGWRVSRFENGCIVYRDDMGVQLSFDRNEMIRLFGRVGQDGVVDQAEMTFLHDIVNDPNVHMPEYVRNLAYKVINHDRANEYYRGTPLGDLTVGSSGTHLARLVGRWFRGESGASWKGATYAYAEGQLFGHGGPREFDVDQGGAGDCYFMAPLAALALRRPDLIRDMFIDNGDGTFTVRFYRNGRKEFVTVDRWLPVNRGNVLDKNGNSVGTIGGFVFGNNSTGKLLTDPSNILWAALAEKAYAQLNESGWIGQNGSNAYEGLDGGPSEWAMSHLTGRWSDDEVMEDTFGKYLDDMIGDFQAGKVVVLNSQRDEDDIENDVIIPKHVYALLGVSEDNHLFLIYNPHAAINGGYIWLNRHDMLVNFRSWTWGD